MVDVLAAIVGVEADNDEREQAEQSFEHWHQEALGERLDGTDELVLRDLVDEVEQIHALGAVAVALMNGVAAHEAGQAGCGPRRSPPVPVVAFVLSTPVRRVR